MKYYTYLFAILTSLLFSSHAQALNPDISAFKKWERVRVAEQVHPSKAKISTALLQAEIDKYGKQVYRTDISNYGVPDYWATRAEFKKRGGDCEDYAIAWYYDLLEAGVSDDAMRIVVGIKRNTQEIHAVFTVVLSGKTYVMDSLNPKLQPANALNNLIVAYRINRNGWER